MGLLKDQLEDGILYSHYVKVGLSNLDSESLPSPPELLIRALDLYASDDTELSDYIALIESDPATSLRVYKLGNSVMYSVKTVNKKSNLKSIAIRLGLASLENLVVSSLMEQSFQSDSDQANKLLRSVWGKSVFIAKALELNGGDYLTGLLCQVGILPILHELEKSESTSKIINETDLLAAISIITPKLLTCWGLSDLASKVDTFLGVKINDNSTIPLNCQQIAIASYNVFSTDSDDYLSDLCFPVDVNSKIESTIDHASEFYNSILTE
ncbi:HDOD domain-containing protein [Shewanella sp. SG44-6]|jgi:hypothetical protein|uniref:HDOD domain-containing protein n=1 Tax=Shewanella sp. SG44-6 TaxID=2760959 RepID=UPI0016048773|nr:HDOD domain-containing protein [Shewanella sp. SG44-6]MBB1389476.1 HDOD domain-containing protein [Shewanella sp. SG44-6]